jgi:dolichol kinase
MIYTPELFIYDMLLMLVAYLYVGFTIVLPLQLKKRDKISKFQARKMVHLLAGLIVLIVPYFVWPWFAVIIAGSLTLLTLFSSRDSKVKTLKDLYDSIGEEAEEKKGFLEGPFHYCLSITLLVAVFVLFAPNQMYFPISGILIMIISDTLASLIGKKYGKLGINIPWTGSRRTVEGSLTFLISAFILCFGSFWIFGYLNPFTQIHLPIHIVLIYSLVTSLIATGIELISPSTWDDLSVPIATTLIIYLLTLLG